MTLLKDSKNRKKYSEYAHSDLAWAAGFFDGEGCIHITREKTEHGFRFGAVVQVAQTSTTPLIFLQNLFGGTVRETTKIEGHKDKWVWRLYGPEIVSFLEETMRFMKVKDCEAGLALIFQGTFNDTYKTGGNERKATPEYVLNLRSLACEACREFKRINL